jgi:hypothetical protein
MASYLHLLRPQGRTDQNSFLPLSFPPIWAYPGLINPAVTGIIGPGVVVHLPSFFQEFDTLREKGQPLACAPSLNPHAKLRLTPLFCCCGEFTTGLDCTGRLFISDRTHLVFDFHQIVDGLKEVELGGSSCVSSFPHLAQLTGLTISQHRYHQERHRPRLLCESVSLGLTRASPLRPYIC